MPQLWVVTSSRFLPILWTPFLAILVLNVAFYVKFLWNVGGDHHVSADYFMDGHVFGQESGNRCATTEQQQVLSLD